MRVVIQRVESAKVRINGQLSASIGSGLVLLTGIARGDSEKDATYLARKVANLRVFPDAEGKMNFDVMEAGGAALIVSNFTVYGDCRKGRRPAFDLAAPAELAKPLYEYFIAQVRLMGIPVETGVFQAHMTVEIANCGPVTLVCDSRE